MRVSDFFSVIPIAAATGMVFMRKKMHAVTPRRTGLPSLGMPWMFAWYTKYDAATDRAIAAVLKIT